MALANAQLVSRFRLIGRIGDCDMDGRVPSLPPTAMLQ